MMEMMVYDAVPPPFQKGEYKGVSGHSELLPHVIPNAPHVILSGAKNLYQFVNHDANDGNDGL